MAFDLDRLVRPNVKELIPYSSARTEVRGDGFIFLDANENSFGSPLDDDYSRYPDPYQMAIKRKVAEINELVPEQIFVGNGSDEAIDLMIRIFCRPSFDNVLICPPTYGVYEVAAAVNDVAVKRVRLTDEFELDVKGILDAIDEQTKLIYLCSPNNPTGNGLSRADLLEIARSFDGLVVVDEAYIHFSKERSLAIEIAAFPNLVILQTLSKAWGLAGLRVGFAFAEAAVVDLFNKVKPPYNVSRVAQELALKALDNAERVDEAVAGIISERGLLVERLGGFSIIEKVYPSDANFLLVKTKDAKRTYHSLLEHKIVVRDRSRVELCGGCLRITVGTSDENASLMEVLEKYEKSLIH